MDTISHKGRIVDIDASVTTVEIVSESACSTCHAKGLCGLSESKVKTVTVPTSGFSNRKVGDEAEVVLRKSMGFKAVWLAYVIPLAVLMAVLFTASALGCGELASGLAGIGAAAIYYLVLYLLRGRLQNDYSFYIK